MAGVANVACFPVRSSFEDPTGPRARLKHGSESAADDPRQCFGQRRQPNGHERMGHDRSLSVTAPQEEDLPRRARIHECRA